ncbi:MAG: PAS domain S-box protein [Bacteroidia bacterium]|nr:PAS domain S-box protein [Bacteroidia bacterium]
MNRMFFICNESYFSEEMENRKEVQSPQTLTPEQDSPAYLKYRMEIKDQMIYDLNLALNESNIVAKTDIRGVITYVNKQFCEVSGYLEEELIGKTHRIINSGYHSKEFFKQFWQTIKKGEIWKGEIRNRKKNGEFYWTDTTIVPITDPQGAIKEYIAIRKEITERKLVEIALQKLNETLQKKIEDMNRFSFITSHNLRAPVANIIGLMQMMKEGRVNAEEIPLWTENVLKVGEELNSIVNDLNQTLSVYSEADNPMTFHQKKIRKPQDTQMVFMIDDDAVTNLIHTRIAAKETPDVKVRSFTDARSALKEISEKNEKPDLILVDINMPKMNGWEFLAALEELPRNQTDGIDIVVLSSSIFSEDKIKAKSFTLVRDFYTKPLTKESYREIFF